MMNPATTITDHLDTWSSALKAKSSAGRGSGKKQEFYGIKKLRELILELAVRGLLIPQDKADGPATELLKKIEKEKDQLVKEGKLKRQAAPTAVEEQSPQYTIPKGWVWTRVGTVGNIFNGNSISAQVKEVKYTGVEGYPFIATKDVGYGFEDIDYENGIAIPIDEEKFQIARKGAVLICAEGGSAGKKCGLTDREICFGNKLFANELFGGILSKYILSVYLSPTFFSAFSEAMTGIIGGISKSKFETLLCPLPPLAEQHRIVAKVDELMALCDQLEQQQEDSQRTHGTLVQTLLGALTTASERSQFAQAWQRIASHFGTLFTTESSIDKLKQTILQLAVMGKLVEQDPSEESASSLLDRLSLKRTNQYEIIADNSADFTVPSNWVWTALGNYAVCSRGRFSVRPRNDPSCYGGPYPFIQIGDLSDDGGLIVRHTQTLNLKGLSISKIFRAGTLVTAIVGATIGNTGILGYDMCFPDSMVGLETDDPVGNRFVEVFLLARKSRIRELSYAGGGQPNIKLSILNPFPFPLPPLAEQRRIVAKVDELMSLCDRLKANLKTAQVTQLDLADSLVETAIH